MEWTINDRREAPLLLALHKSGGLLLTPAPKFKEQGFTPLQKGRGAQV